MKTVILLFLLTLVSLNVYSATIYVDGSKIDDSQDGLSWTNAKKTLQAALDLAVSGDEIWVRAGTYKPTSAYDLTNTSRFYHFRMKNGLAIYGGFAGTETLVSQRNDFGSGGTNETILSGDLSENDNFDVSNGGYQSGTGSDNCYHVFYHPNGLGLTSTGILDGFTIKGGNANGTNPHYHGGGMYNYNNSPTLNNIYIAFNSANLGGGGLFNGSNSSPTITNATIANNKASFGGGIMNDDNSSPTITNVKISNNNASNSGGGIYNNNSSNPIITNATISKNNASLGGGSYTNLNSEQTFNNCIIWGNTANDGYQIYNDDNSTNITNLNYCCYGFGTNNYYGSSPNASNSLTLDPQFVDPDAGDFRIRGISPCKNSGNNSYNSETYDIRGKARIQNTTIDMGAYEWTSGTDPERLIIYVKNNASGSNNGTSWTNAYTSLTSAITTSTSGDQIWVAAGTYKPTTEVGGSGERFRTFQMKNGVEIYGGFAGTEAADYNIDNRNFTTNETILSGDIGTENVSTDNCYHVFYHPNGSNVDETAKLDGFTIKNGNANGASGFTNGAGMYNYDSNPTLNNIIFKDNYASVSGGALNLVNSNLAITNTTFSNNSAVNGGGAVTIEGGGSATITNCTFSSNSVTSGSGGAVYVTATTPTFQFCTFSSNTASSNGGALFADNGDPELTSCTFSSNSAPSGGAIYAYSTSNIVMNAITLYSNSANDAGFGYGGAIVVHSSCTLELLNSLLYSNTSTGVGGAIYIHTDGYGEIINSTLSKNHAGNGGGIYHAGDDLNIFNSILWGNTSSNWGNQLERAAGTVVFDYSCFENDYTDGDWDIEGAVTATNCINTNPHFHSKTTDDFRILGSSPCVNTGSNTYIGSPYLLLTEDIREENRITNTTVDMGCYEYTSTLDRYNNRFFVKHDAAGTNDGSSWTNAYVTLQQALNDALNKDSIFVSTGIYKPTSTYNLSNSDERNKHFRMIEGVSIFGSFAGNENVDTYDFDDRNFTTNSTILSGDIQVADDSLDNCYHVFYHPDGLNLTYAAILDGFEINDGNASSTDNHSRGGGMLNINNSPFLTNVSFSNNSSIDQGGAIYLDNSYMKLYHTMFVLNYANTDGGAIYIANASAPRIVSSAFIQNGAQYSGGAINNNSSNSIIANSLFSNNTATYGGGIFNQSGLNLVNSTLSENYAYQGGGIAVEANATINNSIIWSNDGVIGKDIFIKEGFTATISFSDYSTEADDLQNNGSLAGVHNIHLNPKFKSPYSGDFSILGISPCADAGNNTFFQDSWTIYDIRTTDSYRKIYKTDYTQYGTIDMGCFEYNSNTDLLCRTEAWVSSAYNSSTPNWRATYSNNLDDAVDVTCNDATVNITNYSHTGDVEMGDRTFIVGTQDFDITGDLSGNGLVQVTNTGKLIMKDLSANTTKTFPITDGTYNYAMTVTTADVNNPDVSVRISNLNPTGSINSDFWDIEGPTNLNATVTLRVDKGSIAPKTLGSSTQLRYRNSADTRYVPVNGNNFSIEEFDTYYIITLTGVNEF